MCRNHRGFVEATLAAAKLGASALYLNTMFAGPQLVEVTRREAPKALVYDEEFADLLEGVDDSVHRIVAWTDSGGDRGDDPGAADRRRLGGGPQAAAREAALRDPHLGHHRHAEGRPALQPRRAADDRGAARQDPLPQPRDDDDRGAALPLLGLLPLRDEPADRLDDGAAAPLRPRGDAAGGAGKPRRRAGGGAGDDPADPRPARGDARRYDLSSLRITSLSGSALPGELAIEWMDRFGDNVYNLYGSTEVAYATVATPEDLRAAPGTAGRPPRGTTVRLFDENGQEVPQGEVGRIFVGNEMSFEGYTGGGGKEVDRRPALQRRRRPHRRRRPPLHRRPRRRDDRLRRRERLPARGRGPARRPRGAWSRWR